MKPAEHDPSLGIVHRSPGITAIYNELKHSKRNNVLDLGSASAASFTFFSRLSCHIHFEGIDNYLSECCGDWGAGEQLREGLADYLSEYARDKRFDVILAWDIFNYLDRDTLRWLVEQLNRHCRPNTLLHTIKYVGRNVPATPRHFEIVDQYQVKMSCSGMLCSRPFPGLDTTTTLKSMPDYTMEYTYIQQEGMLRDISEHVMRYQPDAKGSKEQRASAELPTVVAALPPGVQAHRSYGLERICSHLSGLQGASVLDLGSKASRSGDFFLEYAERVYVEDLMPSLLTPAADGGSVTTIRQHALRYDLGVKFNVILAWDLFNYCTPEQLKAIYFKLKPYLCRDTQIFAFFYTGSQVPSRPQRCYILDDKNMALVPLPKRAAGDELNAITLLRTFSEFRVSNTYILRPGMHRGVCEYVLSATPERAARSGNDGQAVRGTGPA